MIYMLVKIIEHKNQHLIIENQKKGYCGYYLGEQTLGVECELILYVFQYKTDFLETYFFFDNIEQRGLAICLLQIKNFGIKSLLDLFKKISCKKILNYSQHNDINIIQNVSGFSEKMCQEIIKVIRLKFFNFKYSKKQMTVIYSLQKLGYKISEIYQALAQTTENKSVESMIKETLVKINESQAY